MSNGNELTNKEKIAWTVLYTLSILLIFFLAILAANFGIIPAMIVLFWGSYIVSYILFKLLVFFGRLKKKAPHNKKYFTIKM